MKLKSDNMDYNLDGIISINHIYNSQVYTEFCTIKELLDAVKDGTQLWVFGSEINGSSTD